MSEAHPPTSLWAASSQWIEARLGLHFPSAQWPELQRRLKHAADRLGLPDARACARRMLDGLLDRQEREVLAECLTIGETYFFREPAMYQQLRQRVLEPLINARRQAGLRHLRLWSAACSSGEEPYSLAMLLACVLPDWREWQISILATDINGGALRKARAGAYGRWSVRAPLPAEAAPFLQPDRRGGFRVDPELRRMVRFMPLNLATADYTAVVGTAALDLVLCRNVLIYFEPARVRDVLARLGRTLTDEGWLVTTSVEMPREPVPGLVCAARGSFAALRRSTAAAGAPAARVPEPASQALLAPRGPATPRFAALPAAARPAAAAAGPAVQAAVPASAPVLPAAPAPRDGTVAQQPEAVTPAELAEQARRCADAGALEQAEVLCRRAMALDGLSASLTYLLASILQERGQLEDAAMALQRTLYLEPDHLLARFALGSLASRRKDGPAARRHLRRAAGQLEGLGPQDVVPGSGGLNARELRAIIRRKGDFTA